MTDPSRIRLSKSTLAQTFKFDCDRFLRFKLLPKAEHQALGLPEQHDRPGLALVTQAGRQWEIEKYRDLIWAAQQIGDLNIKYQVEPSSNGQERFANVNDIFEILNRDVPPVIIIEGQFDVPLDFTPSLHETCDTYGLSAVKSRPDILWIRPHDSTTPIIDRASDATPEYEIHIVDVKMAAEPSLRHFTEVTYYALSLAAALEREGLHHRYAVSKRGFIWPGSHDANAFRNTVNTLLAARDTSPFDRALETTLIAVPYEVYQIHVKQFFEDRLPRVLSQQPFEAAWHIAPVCQLCEYLNHCRKQANAEDHLSRLPWLNAGQAAVLREVGIMTTAQLVEGIQGDTPAWQDAMAASHTLRAERAALLARGEALKTGKAVAVHGRRVPSMPSWADLNIFITVHFDPGSGITFAMGASRVYFQPGRSKGDAPITDIRYFIVDRVDMLNPETERARLVEFAKVIEDWLTEVVVHNSKQGRSKKNKKSAHVFFWDTLEIKQLRRMIERHLQSDDVVELVEHLARLFPPEGTLPDPDAYRSRPGTAMKSVIRQFLGLPLEFEYNLLNVAGKVFPRTYKDKNGEEKQFIFRPKYGFSTPMNDQIPFERAYELWKDHVFLKEYHPEGLGRVLTRDEVRKGVADTIKLRLDALNHIVTRLGADYKDRFTLRKSPFSVSGFKVKAVPPLARNLIAFEKLDALSSEFENQELRALPLEEREARFHSMRDLRLLSGNIADDYINEAKAANEKYSDRSDIMAFTFAETSRDARIKEGDFLLALQNEISQRDLDVPWRVYKKLNFQKAGDLYGFEYVSLALREMLLVTVLRLIPTLNQPVIVIVPNDEARFKFAQQLAFITLADPMVLDPVYKDFSSKRIAKVLETVGGDPQTKRRSSVRRR